MRSNWSSKSDKLGRPRGPLPAKSSNQKSRNPANADDYQWLVCAALSFGLLAAGSAPLLAEAQEQTIHERMFHSRAIEAVVWASLTNYE